MTAPTDNRRTGRSLLRDISSHGMFWPVVALILLVLACGLRSPGFLDITVRDGHLFGQLVDIAYHPRSGRLGAAVGQSRVQ